MGVQDDIGGRGEGIFVVRVTDLCGRKRPFFRPHFLGEKAATLDFMVELIDAGISAPYFFVQVKTTRQGCTQRGGIRRLRVKVPAADVRRLAMVPGPVYLIGIDEVEETGYILAVLAGNSQALSSFPTTFPLDCANLRILYDEVRTFWAGRDAVLRQPAFSV